MPFSELIGQDRAVAALRSALSRGALHHAYLFAGPRGVGKAKAALLLAQAANCQSPVEAERPCGACSPCRKIDRSSHPDVLVLAEERVMAKAGRWEPRSGRTPSRDIVVDQVRDLAERRLAMRRFEGRRRVVVIDPADAMTPQAQNALLKTLEEPPDDTTLVLVAANPDALLPTVRSRCARVAFAPLEDGLVAAELVRRKWAPGDAARAAAVSGGSLGNALASNAKALAARERAVAAAAALDPDDASTWIAFAREEGGDREAARDTCALLEVWLRDVLAFAAAGERARLALEGLAERTRAAAASLAPSEVVRRIEEAREAAAAVKGNASPALALERMLIGWFHAPAR